MTLLDIKNQLVAHFCEKDCFTSEDFVNIRVTEKCIPLHSELITASLAELVEAKLIREIAPGYWILTAPLNASGQDIHISMNIASSIASIINAYLDGNKDKGGRADSLNLSEVDIVMLMTILGDVIEGESKSDKNQGEDE